MTFILTYYLLITIILKRRKNILQFIIWPLTRPILEAGTNVSKIESIIEPVKVLDH
jgi:ABC-type transport system involved in cytochrome c biogenesis permease component